MFDKHICHGAHTGSGNKLLLRCNSRINCLLCPCQGIWSRCFPVHAEVRRLLAEETVGEVKLVKAYFGSPQLHIPRSVEKELGGGALLDIGVYCLQFVLMVFNGERPESIHATGVLLESGMIQHTGHTAEVGYRLVSLPTQHESVITNWRLKLLNILKKEEKKNSLCEWEKNHFFMNCPKYKHLREEFFTQKIPDLSLKCQTNPNPPPRIQ